MSEEIKKTEELSDDQLSGVAGGVSNVHEARIDVLDSRSKSDGPVEDIQATRTNELDEKTK